MTCSPRGAYFNTLDNSVCSDNDGYFTPYSSAVSLNSRSGRLLGGLVPHMFPPKMEKARSVADVFATPADRLLFNTDNYANEFNLHVGCNAGDAGYAYAPYQQQNQPDYPQPADAETTATASTDMTQANETPADTPVNSEDLTAGEKSELTKESQVNPDGTVNNSTPPESLTTNKALETFIYEGMKGKTFPWKGLGKQAPKAVGPTYKAASKRSSADTNQEKFITTELNGLRTVLVNGKENYSVRDKEDQDATFTVCMIIITLVFVAFLYIIVKKLKCEKQLSGFSQVSQVQPIALANNDNKPNETKGGWNFNLSGGSLAKPAKLTKPITTNKLSGGHIF